MEAWRFACGRNDTAIMFNPTFKSEGWILLLEFAGLSARETERRPHFNDQRKQNLRKMKMGGFSNRVVKVL